MRVLTVGLVFGLAVAVAVTPFVYWSVESTRYRNFRVVKDGELYRSGQMPADRFARVVREFGIKAVVSLRDRQGDDGVFEDQAEADYCAANGVAFFRLPPGDWSPVDGVIPGERTVSDFLRIVTDPTADHRPLLIHCFAGIHRTGAHCAVYRMEFDRWPADEAVAEMRSMGTPRTTFAPNLLNYLNGYRPGVRVSGTHGR
jgi:protein tyrosine/serine phosphatase